MQVTPTCRQPFPGGSQVIRQAFLGKDVPEAALDTILSSLSASTLRQYDITYRLWWNFCLKENIPIFTPTTRQVLLFLQNLAKTNNYKYGTFNSHTSAISLICSRNLGIDPILKRFKKGLSRLRPSRPKYDATWDPLPLLQYIEKLDSPLGIQILSQKLVTLLALITGARLQTISLIRLSNIIDNSSDILISISDPIKTSREGKTQPTLHIPEFRENPSLCVANTLREYINRTQHHRGPESDFLFLTVKKPYSTASKDTLGRWVKQLLTSAGINTAYFKPHSTRHASTSAALRQGVPIDIICKTAGWSQSSTFAKFYNRPLVSENSFAKNILDIA